MSMFNVMSLFTINTLTTNSLCADTGIQPSSYQPNECFNVSVCPPGTYKYEDTTECKECPPGTFNGEAGLKTECSVCEPGELSPEGATSCTPCGIGHELNTERNECGE